MEIRDSKQRALVLLRAALRYVEQSTPEALKQDYEDSAPYAQCECDGAFFDYVQVDGDGQLGTVVVEWSKTSDPGADKVPPVDAPYIVYCRRCKKLTGHRKRGFTDQVKPRQRYMCVVCKKINYVDQGAKT